MFRFALGNTFSSTSVVNRLETGQTDIGLLGSYSSNPGEAQ